MTLFFHTIVHVSQPKMHQLWYDIEYIFVAFEMVLQVDFGLHGTILYVANNAINDLSHCCDVLWLSVLLSIFIKVTHWINGPLIRPFIRFDKNLTSTKTSLRPITSTEISIFRLKIFGHWKFAQFDWSKWWIETGNLIKNVRFVPSFMAHKTCMKLYLRNDLNWKKK